MRPLLTIFVTIIIFFSCEEHVLPLQDVEDGVSSELAAYRSEQLSDVTYGLSFNIPPENTVEINSKLKLDVNLANLNAPLYLDFKEESTHLKTIQANGKKIAIVHKNEHIIIEAEHLTVGSNQIEIDFIAGELSLNRNPDYLYTLLVPDRARTLFPCFDQPNLKATYILDISAPKDWEVLCAAPEIKREESDDTIRHFFGPSDKMSTYLFSFVAGKFNKVTQNPGKFDMSLLYRETDEKKIAMSTDTIFEVHQQSITFLEDYTAYPFPFQKLDFAAIPGFQYGGMEHIGAIQYRESSLFLDDSATENRKLGRAKLIAHETSHMWFGDLVTMAWFNDVWMKEVFANFMADKIVNPAFPEINHELAFMTTHYPRAYSEDRTEGTNPIRQELDNLNNAGSLYGSIIYNKAPIMMRQLELVLGEENFRKGIQEYIRSYANGNAVWNDLIKKFDEKTKVDIEEWSAIWVNSASRPLITDIINYDVNDKIASFEIRQHAEDDSKHIWPQKFNISFMYADSIETVAVAMQNEILVLSEVIGMPKPKAIWYNSNGTGYGVFPLDPNNLEAIPLIKDEVTRGYAYINAYENTLLGALAPRAVFEVFLKSLKSEKNELLVNLLSGYTTTLFWKYLNDGHRLHYQQLLADQLWSQLQSELPYNIKKTLFSIFRSVAYSDNAQKQLYDIWNESISITGLKLNEDDYIEIAMDLALYGHPDSEEILRKTNDGITNPDKLERFVFLLPSLSQDTNERDRFFQSLKDEKNRAKEAWVLTALRNLNHPLRQEYAIHNLRPSLDLLEEIQKTGDIFFPKGWLNNTIGAYTSPEAFTIMRDFIAENPDLNPALMKKLLQASDDLRRVQKLNEKFKQ